MGSNSMVKNTKRKMNLNKIPDGPKSINFKRCLLASLVIHSLLLGFGFGCSGGSNGANGKGHSPTAFEAKEGEGDGKDKDKDKANGLGKKEVEMHIIPKEITKQSEVQVDQNKNKKNGFYGIGIQMRVDYNNYAPKYGNYALVVGQTFNGYSAEEAGMKSGDVIVAINNRPVDPDNNGIKGQDETAVILTVYRNGRILNFNIKRCFVETDVKYIPPANK